MVKWVISLLVLGRGGTHAVEAVPDQLLLVLLVLRQQQLLVLLRVVELAVLQLYVLQQRPLGPVLPLALPPRAHEVAAYLVGCPPMSLPLLLLLLLYRGRCTLICSSFSFSSSLSRFIIPIWFLRIEFYFLSCWYCV